RERRDAVPPDGRATLRRRVEAEARLMIRRHLGRHLAGDRIHHVERTPEDGGVGLDPADARDGHVGPGERGEDACLAGEVVARKDLEARGLEARDQPLAPPVAVPEREQERLVREPRRRLRHLRDRDVGADARVKPRAEAARKLADVALGHEHAPVPRRPHASCQVGSRRAGSRRCEILLWPKGGLGNDTRPPREGPRMSIVRLAAFALAVTASLAGAQGTFTNFESGHVRPLALSPAGDRLFAVNTPDNRLEIYDVTAGGLSLAAEVSVGLEPVAVATRTNGAGHTEAWVVNHLSDSVSIVDVNPTTPALSRVTRTLLVGDEPRDIVFAGTGGGRAFITTAHRGQQRTDPSIAGVWDVNNPADPQLTTAGVGRADVWVFDATNPGNTPGGVPLSVVKLFADTPRALAVSPNGATVYAAAFHSGNQTTTITEPAVTNNGGLPPNPPGSTPGRPNTGLIVKFNGTNWVDEINRNWSAEVPFALPDKDVFLIDANANPPALAAGTNFVQHVGTVLFNMVVRPTNGNVYVSNTDALNQVRFEPNVRGHLVESRVTVINGVAATPHHLNPHINYAVDPGPPSEVNQSLAFPTGMAFSADGNTLFVAGFGSGKIGAFDASDLEAGVITEQQTTVGLGPSGIVLDAAHDRLYVMNRIDHTISIVSNASSASRSVTATVPLRFDPSPAAAKNGRKFLYDAHVSGHGDNACA